MVEHDPNVDPPGDEDKVVMTKDKFNQVIEDRLARDREARKKEEKKTLKKLQEMQSSLKMTQEEKDELEATLSEMEKQVLSTEEIQQKEAKKAQERYEEELAKTKERADTAEQRYMKTRVDNTLITAATQTGVQKSSTPFVLSYLKERTKLVEDVDDDGNVVGDKVVTSYTETDKDGNQREVELAPSEALDRMSKNKEYANLFDSKSRGGLGAGSGEPNNTGFRPGMSTEEYMKLRESNPDQIYAD